MRLKGLNRSAVSLIKRIRDYTTPVTLYQCLNEQSSPTLSFMYIGWDRKLRNYWLERLSKGSGHQAKKRLIPRSSVTGFVLRNRRLFDLAIVESHFITNTIDQFRNTYLLPRWMEMIIDIEPSKTKYRVKEIIRRIKKHSLEYEFRSAREDFDQFYYTMYKPLVTKRYGNSAEVANYRSFLDKFLKKQLDLLFIIRHGEPVAAQLIERRTGMNRVLLFGIKEGDEKILRMGVHSVLYHFAMNHYAREGNAAMLCGSSMPVALDGVTQFKMRMGARPFIKDLEGRKKYYVIPLGTSDSLKEALKSNPVFYLSGGALSVAFFIHGQEYERKTDFLDLYKRVKCENVANINLFYFGNPQKVIQWADEEGLTDIAFIKYEGEIE